MHHAILTGTLAKVRALACGFVLFGTTADAYAGSRVDAPQPTEFRLHDRVIGKFDAQSAISRRVFEWQQSLPKRRFKFDMNSYAPERRIFVGKDGWIRLGSDGTVVYSKPSLLGETQRSAKFTDGDPVLEQLREIFADVEKPAEAP